MVVPFQATLDLRSHADVVARWIDIATKDVHEPHTDAAHTGDNAQSAPRPHPPILRGSQRAAFRRAQELRYQGGLHVAETAGVRLRGFAASARQTSRDDDSLRWAGERAFGADLPA